VVTSCCTGHTEVNDVLAPTGRTLPVEGSAYDLRNGRSFDEFYADPALPIAFDDNFVIAPEAGTFRKNVFSVVSRRTGITLEVDTDQPGMQFYMGYWLNGTCVGKCGGKYVRFAGFCLETQLWPDSTNQVGFPNPVLRPGETYTHKTVYRFGVEK
jgi:aldose 1-epimerase